jgi:hypothetical protein
VSTFFGISVCVISLVMTIVTLPNLWRRGTTPWGRLVYRYGVRGAGLWGGVFFSILLPNLRAGDEHSFETSVLHAFVCFLVGLPLWLWMGYWWGRTMAAFFNIPRTAEGSERVQRGELR